MKRYCDELKFKSSSSNIGGSILNIFPIFALAILVFSTSCSRPGPRGPYFIYGLQWGMTWKEVTEVLEMKNVEQTPGSGDEDKLRVPFFIAGVPGNLELTFKKRLLGKRFLKKFQYKAIIRTPDIRNEAYAVTLFELNPVFGEPELVGSPEEVDPDGEIEGLEPGESYAAYWKNKGGDVLLEIRPALNEFELVAEADVENPDLAWLK